MRYYPYLQPSDHRSKINLSLILDRVIPRIAEEKNKGELKSVENIDVFCETGNFGVESTYDFYYSSLCFIIR